MVSLKDVHTSNEQLSSSFPSGLVALFVGATSGIGAATLKAFAKYTQKPRAYFIGQSQSAADNVVSECQNLNPEGEFIFIQANVSLIKVVDEVCAQIKAKETVLNFLFLSQGGPVLDRSGTIHCSIPNKLMHVWKGSDRLTWPNNRDIREPSYPHSSMPLLSYTVHY